MLKSRKKLTKKQIRQDKLVTYYFKTLDYINQNSKIVSGILIGILAVLVIGYFIIHSRRAAELNASVELTKARTEMENNNAQKAIDILRNMLSNYSGTSNAGRGVYYLATIFYEKGESDEALIYFKKYIDDYEDDIILSSASYSGIGACYEVKKDYETAAEYYNKGANKYAEHFEAPAQLMNAARCYNLADDKIQAKKIYQQIIDNFSTSRYKRDAETLITQL